MDLSHRFQTLHTFVRKHGVVVGERPKTDWGMERFQLSDVVAGITDGGSSAYLGDGTFAAWMDYHGNVTFLKGNVIDLDSACAKMLNT